MKKAAAILLTMITIISLASIPASAQYFTDVNIGHWARESINYATDNGYIDSASTYTFNPDGNFTRADVAKMIYRLENSPNIAVTSQFTDVSASASYAKAVSWMVANGIMNGTSSTTFAPNAGIKRQDLALVFFRYGGYLEDKENGCIKYNVMSKRADISGFTDASTVSAYAREAVKWAVATKIITGEVGGVIEPKKVVVRETGAEFLKRFGIFVEGIKWGRDNYGFTNSADCFTDTYYISEQHLSVLRSICNLMGEMSVYYNIVTSTMKSWNGSCHGMCLSLILDKVGKLDINGALDLTTNSLYNLPTPNNSIQNELVSIINFYHELQMVEVLIDEFHDNSSSIYGWEEFAELLKIQIDEYGLVQVGINFLDGGWHAIVLYDYSENSNQYSFVAYDPNNGTGLTSSSASELVITKDTFECSYNKGNMTRSISVAQYASNFQKSSGMYSVYDLDSYYNDFNEGANNSLAASDVNLSNSLNTTMLLSVKFSNDFSIVNDVGEVLSYENGEFCGDMDIVAKRAIVNEGTTYNEYIIKVYNSNYFLFSSSDPLSEFTFMNGNVYSKVSGAGYKSVRINSSGDVQLEGDDEITYQITTNSNFDTIELVEINGFSVKNASVKHEQSMVFVENTNGKYDISTYDTDCYDIQRMRTDYSFANTYNSITISEVIADSKASLNMSLTLPGKIDFVKLKREYIYE